jgi:ubiquinone/menaquinone biosynthesis C-methylase UbiE
MKVVKNLMDWFTINLVERLMVKKTDVENVGEFYNQYTEKFLDVYGEIIQACRTNDITVLLDYQIQSMKLKEGMNVLDAGCGVCGPACYFAEKTGAHIDALTISEEQVKIANEKILYKGLQNKVFVKKGDYHQIENYFPASQYDVVYFLESFGHSPFHTRAIDSAWAALKPGGLLYIKDLFKRFSPSPEIQLKMDSEIKRINENYIYNVADLNKISDYVRKKGWEIAAIRRMDIDNDQFDDYTISTKFQQITGLLKPEIGVEYVFPVEIFELLLYKPHIL